jgi:hypothetical protein
MELLGSWTLSIVQNSKYYETQRFGNKNSRRWTKSRIPETPIVIHHRQNRLDYSSVKLRLAEESARPLCSYSRTFQGFMEPEGSYPLSQEPSTVPCPSQDQSAKYLLLQMHGRACSRLQFVVFKK